MAGIGGSRSRGENEPWALAAIAMAWVRGAGTALGFNRAINEFRLSIQTIGNQAQRPAMISQKLGE
jgi:hypothetical protein